ncbi:DMT family transporter [Candidatus Woesearchaeota archaeon]|nr:DMT family transporter [Candidatus Woesearchaeota archaeon]
MSSGKGFLLAVLSGLCISSSFVFVKYLLQFIGMELLMLLWFSAATIVSWAAMLLLSRRQPTHYISFWKEGLILGFVNFVAAMLWAASISTIGPSLTAFFLRFATIFIIALGIVFLREKLNKLEIAGAAIAVSGALIISLDMKIVALAGTMIAVLAAITIGLQEFISKIYVSRIEPYTLNSLRVSCSFLFLSAFSMATGKIEPVQIWLLPLIISGSAISAVIGFIFYYKALSQMSISKVAIIRTLDPFIVIAYAFLLFRTVPDAIELIGGGLIVLGVILSEVNLGRVKGAIRKMTSAQK